MDKQDRIKLLVENDIKGLTFSDTETPKKIIDELREKYKSLGNCKIIELYKPISKPIILHFEILGVLNDETTEGIEKYPHTGYYYYIAIDRTEGESFTSIYDHEPTAKELYQRWEPGYISRISGVLITTHEAEDCERSHPAEKYYSLEDISNEH